MTVDLVLLAGPTASGKSGAAVALSRRFPFEIVNADSVQVYRGMDIGSAKPSPDERASVPHHLIDIVDPDDDYNAGRFVADADAAISDIRNRGKLPLVVGGTGMYLRSLLRGLDDLPSDPVVRKMFGDRWDVEREGSLHAELAASDPDEAARIHPSDRLRVIRALEILALTNESPSVLKRRWKGGAPRYRTLFLALTVDRALLRKRIDARVDAMIAAGFLDEVRSLLAQGYGPKLKSMGALGYRHLATHLVEGVPLPDAVESMKRDTRAFAKRQGTWLAKEADVVTIPASEAVEAAAREVERLL